MPAGFHTLTTKIWMLFQFPPKPGLAAAAALPLLIITILLLRAQGWILGRRGFTVVGGKSGEPRRIQPCLRRVQYASISFKLGADYFRKYLTIC